MNWVAVWLCEMIMPIGFIISDAIYMCRPVIRLTSFAKKPFRTYCSDLPFADHFTQPKICTKKLRFSW